jgi:hypothetical protein
MGKSGYGLGMRAASAFLVVLSGVWTLPSIARASEKEEKGPDWRLASESGGVKLYSRIRAGSDLKEFKAVATIDAPTSVVHNIINDVEGYPRFMPFIAECRVIKRDGNSIYAYQRISPKIVHDRDYTLHIEEQSWPGSGGLVYFERWEPANDAGPAVRKGVLRVKVCEGAWLLEPETAEKTRATYSVYTDTGGSLPAFIANAASGIGIRKIFAAVRRQAKDPKYREARDLLDAGR